MLVEIRKLWTAVVAAGVLAGGVASQEERPQEPQGTPDTGGIESAAEGDQATLLTLKLKDRDLRDVVASIRRKAGVNIVMDPDIEETVTIDLENVPWRKCLELVTEAAGCIVIDAGANVLKVEKPPTVYFAFENTDIQKIIDMIAKISGANIVVSPDVQGTITIRLKDIPWRDALDAAVKTLGFVVVEEDRGILRVVPASNIEQDLVTRTIKLRYARPASMYLPFLDSEYVLNRQNIQPLPPGEIDFTLLEALEQTLTPNIGTINYFEEYNTLVIKDTRPVVDEIEKIVGQIDIEPPQVYLDVRFVTTSNEDLLDVGISPGGNGYTASIGLGSIPNRLPFDLGSGGWDDNIIANDNGTGPFVDSLDPALNNGVGVQVPDIVFGSLDFTGVSATLRLLKRDATSEILQAPKIVAMDRQTATIFVGEAVRYAQSRVEQGQAGGLLLAVEEGDDSPVNVGFQLLATPHVVPGTDKVMLDVIPQRTALTGTGTSNLAPAGFDVFTVSGGGSEGSIALPRVSSSTLSTSVLLASGQTAVLGGLVTRTQTDTETKLPFLGDIPILGWLFKNKVTNDTRTMLMVFITPHIIRSAEDTERGVTRLLQERAQMRRNMQQQRDAIYGGR